MKSAMEVSVFCQSCLLLKVYTDAGYVSSYHGDKNSQLWTQEEVSIEKKKQKWQRETKDTRTTVRESEMNWSPFAVAKG